MLQYVEVADPVPGPEQVVVDVVAADVLFVETVIRAGEAAEFFPIRPPYVPGGAVAGRVRAVGDGVDRGWVGRKVAGRTAAFGGYAEQAVADVGSLVRVPDELSLPTAAALLHDGPTAFGLFDNAEVRAGQDVVISGASGGLGLVLVQLVRSAGARVIALARGQRKRELVLDAGANVVVDPDEPRWLDDVRSAVGDLGADVVFDGAGGAVGQALFGLTARGGWFSAHGSPAGGFAAVSADERDVTVRGIEQVQFAPDEHARLVARAIADAAAGRVKPYVGQTFPLAKAADAHAAIERREVAGKTLLLT